MIDTDTRKTPAVDPQRRLSREDTFRFACGPQVPCFTECCGKLELMLTPYDLLRLKERLAVSSGDFLDQYCTIRWRTPHGFPEVMMNMDAANDNRCPFVTPKGCSVYEDRPGACRIYPLGRASTSHPLHGQRTEFYFVVREEHCRGFEQHREWKVQDWLVDQGMEEYNRINDLLMELYVQRTKRREVQPGPQHVQMFMMACYNTERFRAFVFDSPFLKKFDLGEDLTGSLRTDDLRLLEFAFQWLKFALFGEPTLAVKPDALKKALSTINK
ncbi:MAG: YkgJ family cysteine cluster protein [Deltaproteobacteria bacterium]|nr:YkgJ family cysteine cluster protein [Deltaproteobacteria bacterium]